MAKVKKTLYQMLEIAEHASVEQIRAAYKTQLEKLKLKQNILGSEEVALQSKLIEMAYKTLSDQSSRQAYDASLKTVVSQPVMMEKSIKVEVAEKRSPLRGVLSVIAGVLVIWLGIQLIYMYMAYQSHAVIGVPAELEKEAAEKLRIQEYYQEHGVRVGSKEEADLLEAKSRKDEEQRRLEEAKKRDEQRKYNEWLAEGQRIGEQIDYERKRAEQQEHYKQEQEQRKLEEDKEQKIRQEEARIEREKQKWRSINSSTSVDSYNNNYEE